MTKRLISAGASLLFVSILVAYAADNTKSESLNWYVSFSQRNDTDSNAIPITINVHYEGSLNQTTTCVWSTAESGPWQSCGNQTWLSVAGAMRDFKMGGFNQSDTVYVKLNTTFENRSAQITFPPIQLGTADTSFLAGIRSIFMKKASDSNRNFTLLVAHTLGDVTPDNKVVVIQNLNKNNKWEDFTDRAVKKKRNGSFTVSKTLNCDAAVTSPSSLIKKKFHFRSCMWRENDPVTNIQNSDCTAPVLASACENRMVMFEPLQNSSYANATCIPLTISLKNMTDYSADTIDVDLPIQMDQMYPGQYFSDGNCVNSATEITLPAGQSSINISYMADAGSSGVHFLGGTPDIEIANNYDISPYLMASVTITSTMSSSAMSSSMSIGTTSSATSSSPTTTPTTTTTTSSMSSSSMSSSMGMGFGF